MSRCAFAIAVLSAATAWGQDAVRALRYDNLPEGTYVLRIDAARNATVQPLVLIEIGGNTPTPPNPPTGTLSEKVTAWAAVTGDPEAKVTRAALAVVYNDVAQRLERGEVSGEVAWRVISTATDMVLSRRNATSAWQPFRSQLSAELNRLRQANQLNELDAIKQIAAGLAIGNEGVELNIGEILAIIMQIIELLRSLGIL